MRDAVLEKFRSVIIPHLQVIDRVAVAGGSHDEPEVKIPELRGKVPVTVHGIEGSDVFLDLNSPMLDPGEKFSLVVCSQVLEHIWRHDVALSNLVD